MSKACPGIKALLGFINALPKMQCCLSVTLSQLSCFQQGSCLLGHGSLEVVSKYCQTHTLFVDLEVWKLAGHLMEKEPQMIANNSVLFRRLYIMHDMGLCGSPRAFPMSLQSPALACPAPGSTDTLAGFWRDVIQITTRRWWFRWSTHWRRFSRCTRR